MIGRTPGYIVAERPLRGGAITDFEVTERMLSVLLHRVGVSRLNRPKVLICVPSAITAVERRAVKEATRRAGASACYLIEQPMAAAIGAGLAIHEPMGNMVVDIGGGTSEMAVISLGGVVAVRALRCGGFDFDASIQAYVRHEHGVAIGERTAEAVKHAIGSAFPHPDEQGAEIRGREVATGRPEGGGPLARGGARRPGRERGLRCSTPRPPAWGGAARAGPGHHVPGDPSHRGWRTAARGDPAAGRRHRRAGAPGGRAARVCGAGGRSVPRIVRPAEAALHRRRLTAASGLPTSATGRG